MLDVNLNKGDVGFLIRTDHFGLVLFLIREADRDLVGVPDHVVVGNDVPILADEETRAQAALLARGWPVAEETAEELFKGILLSTKRIRPGARPRHRAEGRHTAASLHLLRGRDIDDRRGGVLGSVC